MRNVFHDDTITKRVCKYQQLEVVMDNIMTWRKPIKSTSSKSDKRTGVFFKSTLGLQNQTFIILPWPKSVDFTRGGETH